MCMGVSRDFVEVETRCGFPWPRGLMLRPTASRLLGLRVRIPPGAWVSVSCVCYLLSGTGLCIRPIPLPENPIDCGVSN